MTTPLKRFSRATFRSRERRILHLLLIVLMFSSTEGFSQPLTLDECMEIALAGNPEIAQAFYAREDVRIRMQGAHAGFFPELGLNASTGYRSEINTTRQEAVTLFTSAGAPSFIIPSREMELGDHTTTDVSISLWQPVYTGGTLSASLEASRALLSGAELKMKVEQRNVRQQVVKAFYDLAVAREFEKIAAASVSRITGHLDDAQNMLDQGMILKSELLPIRMRKLDSELKVVEAQNAIARAVAALARSMGLPPDASVDIQATWENPPPWPIPPSHSVSRIRVEQELVHREIEAADARIRAARGARLPQVGLTASVHHGWPGFVGNEPDWATWWQAGVTASWNIFDMGRRGLLEQSALAAKRQLKKASETLAGRITQERIVCRLAYEEACRRMLITTEKRETARENYQTQKDHFQVGIATNTDCLDAHTDLLAAEFDLASARAHARVAWNDYLMAMGLDEPGNE